MQIYANDYWLIYMGRTLCLGNGIVNRLLLKKSIIKKGRKTVCVFFLVFRLAK